MRIAFLADCLDKQYGGIHTYTKELLHALAKIDQKNEYFIIRSERQDEFLGMEEIVVPYRNFVGYRAWRLFVQLPKILVKKNVDIVVEPAHFGPFNLPKNIKRVTVIHDMTMFLFPEYHLFASQFLQRKLLPHILKKADYIITNSNNTEEDLHHFFPFTKKKSSTILLGKSAVFRPITQPITLVKYKIKQPYFLYIGTLEPRKNVELLVAAFNYFKSKTHLPHQLILVGKKGWKAETIFQALKKSPYKMDILQLGYVDKADLPVLYSMAEIFVYPSKYEGFGLPVLEAMACGVPVITADISSLPEVGGSAVLYIKKDDVEKLSQKMERLSGNSEFRKKQIQKGLAQAAKFSWKKTATETVQILENMI